MRRLASPLVALLASTAVHGHDPDFTPEQLKAVRALVDRVQRTLAAGDLTAESVWSFELAGFTSHDLDHIPDALEDLPGAVRDALRHVCRATFQRRGPVGRLENARDVCFLLGSPLDADWLRAFRLLRCEPLTEDLDKAVVALGRDDRPEVRLVAAKLAASLIVFGRDSDGLLATVLAGLTDHDPNVAAACALREGPNTKDKRVIDRMVACLSDDRALSPRASPLLDPGGWKRVNDAVAHQLSWMFFMERRARAKWMPTTDRSGEPEFAALTPDEIRSWWKENRETYGFGTPVPQWRCVLDTVLVVDVGKPLVAKAAGGIPLKVDLKRYEEGWRAGTPITTTEGAVLTEVLAEECQVATIGNPDHDDGYVSWERGLWPDDSGEVVCQAAFLPTSKRGRVRVRLTVHIGHEASD